MKRLFSFAAAIAVLGLGTSGHAYTTNAPFTAGNIVVYRVGNGVTTNSLSNLGTRIHLDEYTTNGVLVNVVLMPTNFFGAFHPIVGSGTAAADGFMTRSADGRFITVTGYGSRLDVTNAAVLPGTSATTVPRVVATVDSAIHIDTSTAMTNSVLDGSSIRSGASTDGTNLWFSGDPISVNYTTRGSNDESTISGNGVQGNTRTILINSNQLYVSSASSFNVRVGTAGTGLPTTPTAIYTNLPGLETSTGSPYQFVFVTQKTGGSVPDTLYVADDLTNAVMKWSLVGTNWVNNGSITAFRPRGVTASVEVSGGSTNVHLFITGGGGTLTGVDDIYYPIDSSGYNQSPTVDGNDFTFGIAAVAKSLRGIAFAPVGSESSTTNSGAGRLSVGPIVRFNSSGLTGGPFTPSTNIYSVANLGTNTISFAASVDTNWVTLSSTATNSLAGGASVNIIAALNASANSLDGGTNYLATITFLDLTNSVSTTRPMRLTISALSVSNFSSFFPSGPVGGPFTTNYVYYLTNSSSAATSWSVTNSTTWLVYSASNGTLAGNTSTAITFSVGSVATNFARGPQLDRIAFNDVTRGIVATTRFVSLQVGLGFYDDFCAAPFVDGNLAGQNNWYESMGIFTTSVNPQQISACKAWQYPDVPLGTDWSQSAKDFGLVGVSNTDLFAGLVMTVTSAAPPAITTPSYNVGLSVFPGDNGGDNPNFRNYRLNARDTGTGTFVFGARANGFAGPGSVFGSIPLSYGTAYNVIIRAHAGGTNMTVYVNPTSAVLGDQVAYVTNAMTGGFPVTLGSIALNGFAGNNGSMAGVGYGRISISTNYAEVFSELTTTNGGPALTPFQSWQTNYFGSTNAVNAAANADPDGDGLTNTNEFLAGFNPTNSAARVRVISVAASGIDEKVTYLGASGDSNVGIASRTNVLEFTVGTSNGSYTNNFLPTGQTNILSGGNGLGTVTNMIDSGGATNTPSRYYRVRVLTP